MTNDATMQREVIVNACERDATRRDVVRTFVCNRRPEGNMEMIMNDDATRDALRKVIASRMYAHARGIVNDIVDAYTCDDCARDCTYYDATHVRVTIRDAMRDAMRDARTTSHDARAFVIVQSIVDEMMQS
jgi:hypothetical protein